MARKSLEHTASWLMSAPRSLGRRAARELDPFGLRALATIITVATEARDALLLDLYDGSRDPDADISGPFTLAVLAHEADLTVGRVSQIITAERARREAGAAGRPAA